MAARDAGVARSRGAGRGGAGVKRAGGVPQRADPVPRRGLLRHGDKRSTNHLRGDAKGGIRLRPARAEMLGLSTFTRLTPRHAQATAPTDWPSRAERLRLSTANREVAGSSPAARSICARVAQLDRALWLEAGKTRRAPSGPSDMTAGYSRSGADRQGGRRDIVLRRAAAGAGGVERWSSRRFETFSSCAGNDDPSETTALETGG